MTGGTISTDGRLEAAATSVGANTQLAQMASLTEQAQARKARVQNLVDQIVTWFVPAVITLAIIVTTVWTLTGTLHSRRHSGSGSASSSLRAPAPWDWPRPTALMVGIGRAATLGILIKGHDALEASGNITTVVLDKTGTLTTGRMTVETVTPFDILEHELSRLAALIERGSEHVIARAIQHAARAQSPTCSPARGLHRPPWSRRLSPHRRHHDPHRKC